MTYYTVKEAAKSLKLAERTIRRMLKRGELRHRKFAGQIRIPATELEMDQEN
jgi:excisionase family DNA binding protein